MQNILTQSQGRVRKINWGGGLFIAAMLLLATVAIWMAASQLLADRSQQRQSAALAAFEAETGIRVLRVAITAGGGMLDLQYQVVDPDKSLIVHDDDNPPTLVDQATGTLMATPWHDHNFREMHTAVTYHELIMNRDGLLERGSKITLTIGDTILEDLIVE
jgi:hypothetical protein